MKVLIIEDDAILAHNINEALTSEGFVTENVYDGTLAHKLLIKEVYDCIIMDVNLPGTTGFDLCKQFRSYNNHTPVILLTAFGELEDKVKGFDNGADDYLTKPFYMRELILRINSLIKRSEHKSSGGNDHLILNDISINLAQKKVERRGTEITLTPREFQILVKLCKNRGDVVSKSDLIREIWGASVDANTNTIEVYINFLRNKIDKPFGENSIKTKVGFGYYIDPHEDQK
ncbi:MAG: response regulator transcription factor [Crocinitomicaceae bacterium]|nr:response regulator transcription factor [Crocinitomicaceae bacterium]NGF74505.1 response regulator transcription factor [Fluviicola sp. SGL-29]